MKEKIMEAFLAQLGYEIETKEWNEQQEEFSAPIHNAGTCYKTDMFVMRSYYWGQEETIKLLGKELLPKLRN